MKLAALSVCLLATGCFGTPTPLAPGIQGSVGAPHHGVLTTAKELPEQGEGFVRYRRNGPNHWGNPRLVDALMSAARRVAKDVPGGAPLVIGDLSAKDGGKIPRHQSHRSGRDVDLPWYVTTPASVPVQNPGFVAMGADGLAKLENGGGYVRLDLPREWLLVKTLLEATDVDVEWMFCSREVEALLVDYARARGEPDELVFRAETVLWQPGDSLTHDDHIHLRIACSAEEAVFGCEGGGPRWEWLRPFPELAAAEERALVESLGDGPAPLVEEPEVAPGG
ncbi:MAG TPA: penicillin-insensitive murein endopeptidase [Polyangiaceae bacterium]|nr:penicillin-insensitive murein endopeptidase [Polyangiaceae bacterium]